jgi:Uma2 family endonuclease
MATISPPAAISPPSIASDQRSVLHGVSWRTYRDLLNAHGEGPVRLTYHRGVLEIMTLSQLHERLSLHLHNLISTLSQELGLEIASVGSTTMHSEQLDVGAEADQSYYIRHEEIVRDRAEYDPAIDPPPDLAVEIDLSSKSFRRLLIYAALGIPEVWQYDGEHLVFKTLTGDGQYCPIERSLSFPSLASADLEQFVKRHGTVGENALLREFREWLHK